MNTVGKTYTQENNLNSTSTVTFGLTTRGYTSHEHLDKVNLINMPACRTLGRNGRLYDPLTARMLSPDPFVQNASSTQNFNRYSYCWNNPLKYTDPTGEFIFTLATLIAAPFTGGASLAFLPAAIGADFGTWQGGSLANGTMNPFKWDYSSGKTWGYMLGGAVVGGASGYIGGAIAAEGGFMANTMGIMAASHVNSVGMGILSGGQTDYTLSFGVASYNFTQGEWGYLGKPGNSTLENIGYGFGALANVSDILTGFRPQKVDLVTENSDAVGHSAIVEEGSATATGYGNGNPAYADPNGIISVGPNRYTDPSGSWHWMKGTNHWDTHTGTGEVYWRQTLNVNKGTITKYANWLNAREVAGKLNYSVEISSCVSHTSRALNLSGIFNIGIHPYLLNAQMYLWSNGIRPWTFSYFLNQ